MVGSPQHSPFSRSYAAFLFQNLDNGPFLALSDNMPFKSARQANYLKMHYPELYRKWKRKYGLPVGLESEPSDSKNQVREASRYPDEKESVVTSHAKLHKNYTPEDTSYYKRVHARIVSAMIKHGIEHRAYMGDVLDESLTKRLRASSKWVSLKAL